MLKAIKPKMSVVAAFLAGVGILKDVIKAETLLKD